jgi:hypothetical protein
MSEFLSGVFAALSNNNIGAAQSALTMLETYAIQSKLESCPINIDAS